MDCWNKKIIRESKRHAPEVVFQMVDFDEVAMLIEETKKL
jgi:hypothetical protein